VTRGSRGADPERLERLLLGSPKGLETDVGTPRNRPLGQNADQYRLMLTLRR